MLPFRVAGHAAEAQVRWAARVTTYDRRLLKASGTVFLLYLFWGLEFLHYETETTVLDVLVALVLMLGPFAFQGFREATEDPGGSARAIVKYVLVGVALAPLLWGIMAVVVVVLAAATHQIRM